MSMEYTSILRSDDIGGNYDADRAFGEDSSLIIARPRGSTCSCSSFWFTVPEGFYAIVTRHGIQQDYKDANGEKSCVWPPGFHIGPPWLKVSHLVTRQDMILKTSVNGCKTKDNVSVNIDLAVVFRVMGDKEKDEDPQNVYKFVHFVTPRGLEKQLKTSQSHVIRKLVRKVNHSNIYGLQCENTPQNLQIEDSTRFAIASREDSSMATFSEVMSPMAQLQRMEDEDRGETKQEEFDEVALVDEFRPPNVGDRQNVSDIFEDSTESFGDIMTNSLNEEFNANGVEILDVIINGVSLSDETQSKMAETAFVLSELSERNVQYTSDMLQLVHEEEVAIMTHSIQEEKIELLKEGEHEYLLEYFEHQYEKAQCQDSLQKIRVQMEVDVNTINAESEYTVQKIMDVAKLDTNKIEGETAAEAGLAKIEAVGEAKYTEAVADMQGAKFEAIGEEAVFRAEVISTPMMRQFNDHQTSLLKLKAQNALANNDKLIITGTSGGKAANKILMADAALKNKGLSTMSYDKRQVALAELALLTGNAKVHFSLPSGGVPIRNMNMSGETIFSRREL